MKKLLIAAAGLVVLIMAAGDAFFVRSLVIGHPGSASSVARTTARVATDANPDAPHLPKQFVHLSPFVVTLPGVADASGSNAVLQIGLSFGTHEARAEKDFDAIQPMIKAAIVSTIMGKAGTLNGNTPQQGKAALAVSLLDEVNQAIYHDDPEVGAHAFFGAYITSFILQ